jgi:PAS domain S-box-containing protein
VSTAHGTTNAASGRGPRTLLGAVFWFVLAVVFVIILIDHLANLRVSMLLVEVGFFAAASLPILKMLSGLKREASTQRKDLEWLADIARRTTNAVIITDANRRVLWVNDAFTRMAGYTLEEMAGRVPGHVLFSTNTNPATIEAMFECLSNGRGFQGELLNRAKDGSDYWVQIDMQPRRDDEGTLLGFMAVESDITERKTFQLEQDRTMAELAGFFESSLELLCILDLQGRYVKVNSVWEGLLGLSCEELCTREFREFVHPDDLPSCEQRLRTIASDGPLESFRNRYRGKDGTWRTLEWRASVRGSLIYGAARDVTERIEMERALLEQIERTTMALDGGDLGTWDWELQTDTLKVNERWAAMVGETLDTVGDTTDAWASRVHPEDLPVCKARLWDYMNDGVPYHDVQFRMRHRDGHWRWMRASGKVVSWDDRGEPIRMVGTHADVTDLVLSEERQRVVLQRMELALQAGQMGVWDWDLDTGEFTCDERWASILGERVEDLVPDASTLFARVHPSDIEALETEIQRHTSGHQRQFAAQCRMRHLDGSWRWVRIAGRSIRPSRNHEGGRLVGIQMDVHEQVKAQAESARRETVLANTARMAGIGGWELEVPSMELHWSDQVHMIHELPPEYVPTVDLAIGFYEDDSREEITEGLRRAIECGEPFDMECRFVTAKGRRRWVRSVGEAVYEGGKVVGVAGAFQDITEHVAQRRSIEEANRELEVAQSISRMGSWRYDARTERVEWSRHLFELFELSPEGGAPTTEQILGHYIEEDSSRLAEAIDRALRDGTAYAMTLRRKEAGNGVWHVAVEGRASLEESGEVIGLFGTARDVTAEVEREAALRDAQLRAEDASRSKTEFLANMSHEIRTPMTAILGYADLLDDPTLSHGQRSEHVETIKRNGEHLLTIINDILDVSKIEAGRMLVESLEVGPAELLGEVARLMRVKADAKGLGLALERRTAIPELVVTDPTKLRQILVNLVGNAVKFTAKGNVSVTMGYEPLGPSGTLWFEVRDTGIGMTPQQLEHVFTAFTQADASTTRRFGGTGLGLRISRRLANLLGGDIRVQSVPGEGSVFTASISASAVAGAKQLPAGPMSLSTSAGVSPAPTGSEGDGSLAGTRILLMEDGLDNLRLIGTHLRRAGASVTTAEDGRQGLSLLTVDGTAEGALKGAAPFDVIVTDMQMPEIDGYAVVEMLRARGCSLPIVALTAHSMLADRARCLAVGCDAYAAKPASRQQLVDVIVEAMSVRATA